VPSEEANQRLVLRVGAARLSFQYVIDRVRGLVISTASDCLTFADWKNHQDCLLRDPAFEPTFNQLVDLTAVTTQDTSSDEIKILARRAIFSSNSRRAFVAPSPSIFAITRVFGAHHSMSQVPTQLWVFQDIASAWEWLGTES
jgi:hypothetical protein